MKKLLLFSACVLLIIQACDKVKEPIQNPNTNNNSGNTPPPAAADVYDTVKRVLVEDYTGHKCGNCPAAAIVAENLYSQYQGKVIPIAVHAGFFAKTSVSHPTSYTCTAGNEWDGATGFGISLAGNPNGMVNRKDFPGHGLIQKEDKWPTTAAIALAEPRTMNMLLKVTYDPVTRIINSTVKAKFVATYTNNIKLQVVFTEDSVIGPQTDYSKNPDYITNYVFMHMLRGDLNGPWGSTFKNAPVAVNDSAAFATNPFTLDAKYKDKHVTVIAFTYDATTREVLQVIKKKIKS